SRSLLPKSAGHMGREGGRSIILAGEATRLAAIRARGCSGGRPTRDEADGPQSRSLRWHGRRPQLIPVLAAPPWRRRELQKNKCMEDSKRRLLWHGMFLFLLGLLTGFVEQNFTNVRMGLAAHLEGVMNGIFLLALGAIWAEVGLSPRLKVAAY